MVSIYYADNNFLRLQLAHFSLVLMMGIFNCVKNVVFISWEKCSWRKVGKVGTTGMAHM